MSINVLWKNKWLNVFIGGIILSLYVKVSLFIFESMFGRDWSGYFGPSPLALLFAGLMIIIPFLIYYYLPKSLESYESLSLGKKIGVISLYFVVSLVILFVYWLIFYSNNRFQVYKFNELKSSFLMTSLYNLGILWVAIFTMIVKNRK